MTIPVTAAEMTAEEFKKLREALGYSQRQMAKRLKVSHTSIARAEQHGPSRALESYLQLALQEGLLNIVQHQRKSGKRRGK